MKKLLTVLAMRKWWLFVVTVVVVISMLFGYMHIRNRVTRIELPKGELKWSTTRPTNTKMCIPAAFSDINGDIVGSYRIDGKTYQHSKMRMKVSLKEDRFYINRNWMSDNGFQQLTLVCDSKPMKFKDSRKAIRRALCKDKNGVFILESNYPMSLTSFAYYCSRYCTNAAYLDMGEYGYGYIKNGLFKRHLYIWGLFTKHKQTNWLYIE